MSARIGGCMGTWSGQAYYPCDPRAAEVRIEDIAHALSHLCRFGGHSNWFYSVAEHSVYVSQVVPPEHALQALLHDATEAYCVDVPRPLKIMMPEYAKIEHKNWLAIAERFDLPVEMHPSVKQADNDVLLAEKKVLMLDSDDPDLREAWKLVSGVEARVKVRILSAVDARRVFLERFRYLTGAKRRAKEAA
jgi:5'-deoxynucleotidase YfbR-like HD superfamily hydrolase